MAGLRLQSEGNIVHLRPAEKFVRFDVVDGQGVLVIRDFPINLEVLFAERQQIFDIGDALSILGIIPESDGWVVVPKEDGILIINPETDETEFKLFPME